MLPLCNSWTIKNLSFAEGVKVVFFCFKQLLLNIKQGLESPFHLIDGKTLLSIVRWVASFLAHKPLDFYDATFFLLPSIFKV